ncbi:MAG: hypothetical protein NW241_16390 [Bacteroidia bacterium]|nr:hypothetical protein [Bacteroidia bacterium]
MTAACMAWFRPCAAFAALLAACTPAVPDEAAVRQHIRGVYCREGYRLVLTDSSYHQVRRSRGVFTSLVRESCEGRYDLAFETDRWVMRFLPDPRPDYVYHNCRKEYVLWTRAQGYLTGTDTVRLQDLFDGVWLTRGACGSDPLTDVSP